NYPRWGCYKFGRKGHVAADCRMKLCDRCNGRGHTADVCPTAKEKAVLAVTSEIGAGVDDDDNSCGSVGIGMGKGESAWQVGDKVWICDSGASTHMT
ncbi:unnamed protein product, partial [Laminaria digitata]